MPHPDQDRRSRPDPRLGPGEGPCPGHRGQHQRQVRQQGDPEDRAVHLHVRPAIGIGRADREWRWAGQCQWYVSCSSLMCGRLRPIVIFGDERRIYT